MIKGYYFTLYYNIKLDTHNDIVEYILSKPKLIEVEIEDDGITGEIDDDWYVFFNRDLYDCNGVLAYVNKYKSDYEYIPNQYFDSYEYISWDIDDFGDTDEGWSQYLKACKNENELYEGCLKKNDYECFVVTESEDKLKIALEDIIEEFCKENDIQ